MGDYADAYRKCQPRAPIPPELREVIARHPEWQKRPGETSMEYGTRMSAIGKKLARGVFKQMP